MNPKVRKVASPTAVPLDVLELFDTAFVNSVHLDEYLLNVVQRCAAWFNATGASLFLQSDRPDAFVLAAKAGDDSRVPEDATINAGQGIAGRCVESRKPMLVGDIRELPELKGIASRKNVGSALVVPLVTTEDEVVGVLNLSRRPTAGSFDDDELHLASSIAGHLALAVSNGRLLSQLRMARLHSEELGQQLDTVIHTLAVGVVVFDGSATVVHANREATSFSNQAQLGATSAFFINAAPKAARDALDHLLVDALAGLKGKRFVNDHEADRAWSISASPMPGGGATLVVHDATEHERMNREVHRVRRLAEIGQMTAAIAHEIRNPLAAMRGAAQLIQSSPEHALEFGAMIQTEVDKLNELCTDFLDFARPLELHLQPTEIGSLIADLAERHRAEFETAGVTLVVAATASEPAMIDRNRVEQVVRNLMLNALQATQSGGTVRILVENGRIVVEDDGPGMEQTTVEKLFTPFFTTKANGTGLGLSTARKIIDAHGGSIHVSSRLGEGTRFKIALEKNAA